MNWILIIISVFIFYCTDSLKNKNESIKEGIKDTKNLENKVIKTEEEWKAILKPEEYKVLREKGTERAFTGEYYDLKKKGKYYCRACGNLLFESKTKYDSGSGWPSFYKPVDNQNIETEVDKSLFVTRTEIHCARCGGHLGHVFEDGPDPTGLRYCINSLSLKFVEE
ncbi:MAG: peptide-methionine (R)-S-oxide reductase MsrB [Leptospiraceae bacterium]|nr:peptide-methionine (R)-S-oxide reductase MsrB [Leptospiraceae bacterium]